jgi:hypothetical protein
VSRQPAEAFDEPGGPGPGAGAAAAAAASFAAAVVDVPAGCDAGGLHLLAVMICGSMPEDCRRSNKIGCFDFNLGARWTGFLSTCFEALPRLRNECPFQSAAHTCVCYDWVA